MLRSNLAALVVIGFSLPAAAQQSVCWKRGDVLKQL